MATVAARARALPTRFESIPAGVVPAVLLIGALTLFSIYLRTKALGASLWMDEGLSIGVASQDLFDIPTVLQQDGSPPFYYMLLHVWMDWFGSGPKDTQSLSVFIAVLTVPGAAWAGWSLFGRRAGVMCAALAAFNPFLTTYAQEVRMYSLMVCLSVLITAAFLHVFVYRRRGYIPLFSILLALIVYTHNWGAFVGVGLFTALVPVLMSTQDRRAIIKDALIGFGAAVVLYLPWVPTLLGQIQETGAPWLNSPRFGAPVQISKAILGGGTVTVALVLAGGTGLMGVLSRSADDRDRTAIYTAVTIGVATLAFAWMVSQVAPAWTTRYLGVSLGPIILLAGLGLSRAGKLGLVALAIVLMIWSISPKTVNLENKSNAADLGVAVSPLLKQGDVVVTLQPEQHPLITYHLPGGLKHATELGAVQTKGVMDWRNADDKLEDATPTKNLKPLLDSLPVSSHVLLVHPVTTNIDDWDAPWTELVRRRSAQWGRYMELDGRFTREATAPPFYRRARRIGVRGVLYTKTRED